MSVCEFHRQYESLGVVSKEDEEKEPQKVIIQDEISWGMSYRHFKQRERDVPIPPKQSPIDIPFKLCREEQRQMLKRKKKKKKSPKSKDPKEKLKKLTLLEKSVLSQSKYCDYLSIPQVRHVEPPPKPRKIRCELEPCPPRFVQLAVPNKRRVFANWKDYYNRLPAEMVLRYEKILHTDKNLDPRDARYYYKKLDKDKKKRRRQKRRRLRKLKKEKEKGDTQWLRDQIALTTDVIMEFMEEQPLFSLNYKQMQISDGILEHMHRCEIMKKPSRNSKSHYNKTIVEVSDKLAVWVDTLIKFVDIQAVESDKDIPPVSMASVGDGEESEEESSEGFSSEGDEGKERDEGLGVIYGKWGYGDEEDEFGEKSPSEMEDLVTEVLGGENAGDIDGFLEGLDDDLLSKLIRILENCSDEFLDSLVNDEKLPGVKYKDILKKIKILKEGEPPGIEKKPYLEEVLIEWALQNNPDQVDDNMLKTIHDTAALLNDLLFAGALPKFDHSDEDWSKVAGIWGEEGMGGISDIEGDMSGTEDLAGTGGIEEEEEGKMGMEGEIGEERELEGIEEIGGEAEIGAEGGIGGEVGIEEEEVGFGFGEVDDGTGGRVDGEGGTDMPGIDDGGIDGEIPAEDVPGVDGESEFGPEGFGGAGFGDLQTEQEEAAIIEPEQTIDDIIEDMKKEEMLTAEGEEMLGGFGEEEEETAPLPIDVIYPGGELTAEEAGVIIKGHKPSVVLEHTPGTVCCLSLKIWAVWLLEITHNAHTWTKWVHEIVKKVREFVATIRGDVILRNGQKKVLYKHEWRKFAKETEQNIIAWRQYSAHVTDLSSSIVENFHGKKVNCCPKCLQDHLIKNVVTAHETLQALTEAMNCASYWQRVLDGLVDQASVLTNIEQSKTEESESESGEEKDLEEVLLSESSDDESIYEIEEIEMDVQPGSSGTHPPRQGGTDPGAPEPSGHARCTRRDKITKKFK
ncbi:unnamed protein product [Acanthoscelides obtectus]|uniref:Uncharacterized protein n=2 Tax=Acanthoscelides obtectus TaxID=200917 RepID=A0A9P0L8H6_ACAOB|nr:unnamed protein product [Acanthoscelides obtectus]CAK1630050.1 hypothetical protein AOBTE_LOCUS6128 [Acanthoscelides obtectus]